MQMTSTALTSSFPSITKDDHGFIKDDTGGIAKPKKGSLRRAFGKALALVSLAATMAFYAFGFQIGAGFYNQWQENKAEVTQSQGWTADHKDYTKDLPWAPAGAALAGSFGAGLTAIALGKKKRDSGGSGYYGGSSYSSSDDGFWWGYWMGSSNSSSSSSSSSDNGGAAAVLVIGAAAALAAGASVVSYKALKANFGGDPEPDNALSITAAPRRSTARFEP
jgi:hypothetical protein